MSYFSLDAKQFDQVTEKVQQFSDGAVAESIINEYLHGEGGDLIKRKIQELLPVSGRTWRGKKAPAKSVDPFIKEKNNLSVKAKTKNGYHYLYFPDDGGDTKNHYGNKQFMFDGASQSSEQIANEIIENLIKKLEE